MVILGINFLHGDSSACILVDGKLISAVEEERFSRIKHDSAFPIHSINFCLESAKLNIREVNIVSVNYNSKYNFFNKIIFLIRFLFNINLIARLSFTLRKNSIKKIFQEYFNQKLTFEVDYIPHHKAHISSSYLCSGFNDSIGFTFDGSGDFSTCEIFLCTKNKINLIEKSLFPHSLGIFYQAFTQFLGFNNYGDEYKMMGLAAYGKAIYKKKILKLFKSNSNSFIDLNLKYFSHHKNSFSHNHEGGSPSFSNLFSKNFEIFFGLPRKFNKKVTTYHKNLAASVQAVFEDKVIEKLNELYETYQIDKLCMAGGCALNSALNGKIFSKTKFKEIYIPPNPGDGGAAVGAALFTWKSIVKDGFVNTELTSPFLGTSYSNAYIYENIVKNLAKEYKQLNFKYIDNFNLLIKLASASLQKKEIIGWFQDKMEFGPRALGNRSILADPRSKNVVDFINLKIKKREDFRPFAPSILHEFKDVFFEMKHINHSLFMSGVFNAKNKALKKTPGIVHVNMSSRVQTVTKEFNEKFYLLLKNFYESTGVPILINTSLNIDSPICESPENAIDVFYKSNLDKLFLQNWLITKNEKH